MRQLSLVDATRHQFCWAHVQRGNLQKMADYARGGLTARIGRRLVLCRAVFRCQHRYQDGFGMNRAGDTDVPAWRRRLDYWLKRQHRAIEPLCRRCQYPLKYEQGGCGCVFSTTQTFR